MPLPAPAEDRLLTVVAVASFATSPATPSFADLVRTLAEPGGGRVAAADGPVATVLFAGPRHDESIVARAVRVALALRRAAEAASAPGFRAGIHTRELPWTFSEAERGVAAGQATMAAQEVLGRARPGTILANSETERTARASIRFQPEGGGNDFEAIGDVDTRRDLRGDLRIPLIGRDTELASMLGAFEQKRGGFILIEGDAGIGKSRLIREFRHRLSRAGADILLASGRAQESVAGPLAVFGDLILPAAGITGVGPDDGERLAVWIADHLAETISDAIERENCAHLIAQSLGLRLAEARITHIEPARLRSETHYAWVRWLGALASRRPLVLCLEDLHHADEVTLSLLDSLTAGLAGQPILIVASRRPTSRTPRGFERIRLHELAPGDGRKLAEAFLGAPIDDALSQDVAQQTGGHPYYIEEFARYLMEARLVAGTPLHLVGPLGPAPGSLHDLLVARIDSLGPEDRDVLKAASAFGNVFWAGLLERTLFRHVERVLERARRRQIVELRTTSQLPGEQEYTFRHALLRDAAYSLLTPPELSRIHRTIADLLERQVPQGGRRVRSLVAGHREKSGGREEPARLWHEAGQEALQESAYGEALQASREAIRLGRGPAARLVAARALVRLARLDEALIEARSVSESQDASPEEIAGAKILEAEVYGRRGQQDRFLALVEEVAATQPPGGVLLEALARKARVLWGLNRHDEAMACVADLRQRLQAAPDDAGRRGREKLKAEALAVEGLVHWKKDRLPEAFACFEQALALGRALGDRVTVAAAYNSMGALHRDGRQDAQARAAFEQAIRILREIGDRIGIASGLANLGLVCRETGAFAEAIEVHRESIEIFRQAGDRSAVARGLKLLSDVFLDRGDFETALTTTEESLLLARSIKDRNSEMLALRNVGLSHAAAGRPDRAMPVLQEALAAARQLNSFYNEAFILTRLSDLFRASGLETEAGEAAESAVRVASAHRAHEREMAARLAVARVLAGRDEESAMRELRAALRLATVAGSPGTESMATALLARILAERGDLSGAREQLQRLSVLFPQCVARLDRLRVEEDSAAAQAILGVAAK